MKKTIDRPAFRSPAKIAVSTTVRCSGREHRIVLTKSGRLVLVDHPDLKAERAMIALGGDACTCMEIYLAWCRHNRTAMTNELLQPFDEAWGRQQKRARRHCAGVQDPLLRNPLRVRTAHRTVNTIRQCVIKDCIYRGVVEASYDVFLPSVRILSPRSGESGSVVMVDGVVGQLAISVPITWLARIWKRGLAVVDGWLVVNVLDEDEHGIRVLAGWQDSSNVNMVETRTALVRTDTKGRNHLQWQ